MLQDRGGTPSLTPAECFVNYADALLREFGGSADRALAAARAVAADSADETGYPMRWRHVTHAVELCQRAAEMTGRPARLLPAGQPSGTRLHPLTPTVAAGKPGRPHLPRQKHGIGSGGVPLR